MAFFGAALGVATLASHLVTGDTRTSVRCTTWNLEWFPNGSAYDASPEEQSRRMTDAAAVLQEVRDYDACSRLGNAIEPGAYHVEI